MRRLHFLMFSLIVCSLVAFGQGNVMIQSFDSPLPDTNVVGWTSMESGTTLVLTTDNADKMEGTASVNAKANLAALHGWGTYNQFGVSLATTATPWDFSSSDSISIWIKVRQAPTHPEYMVFRMEFGDRPNPTDAKEMWIYENTTILDNTSEWVNLRIPFLERTSTGTEIPDSTGFIIAPLSWGGFVYNNKTLDRNAIVEWNLAIVTSGWDPNANLPADSMEVSFDGLERFGVRSFPVVIFSGKDWPTYFGTFAWGQSALTVEQNAGTVPGENAVKWTQGNEWSNGWTGWGGNFSSPFNMAGAWLKDSLKMMIKTDSCGLLRAQFESGGGKNGLLFQPIQDGQWHQYALPLRDFVPQDNTTAFDSSAITVFGIMAEASAVAGRVIYLTEIWTGTPTIDVIAPPPPPNVAVVGASYTNLVTWDAVPNEPGVRYNVYTADHPWTDVADTTVEDIPPYNLTSTLANHLLRAPVTDQDVTLYYGVTAKDLAGNTSAAGVASSSTTTLAKGVPTFALAPPAPWNLVADGVLSEWSGVAPFWLSVVTGTAHGVPNYLVSNDADLSVNAYLAVDASYLYVAFDVTDNIVFADTATGATDYQQDSPDLFIGLYDWRGPHHSGYSGGTKPDYHLRFSRHRVWLDNGGVELMHIGNPNYAWVEKSLTSGYVVEAKIPWTLFATLLPARNDVVFSPKEGMRIPMDFAINDNDGTPNARHAIMCYSPISDDRSWSDQFMWTYTWIGNKSTVGVKENAQVAKVYALDQNYPNPFNPSTQIRYSLEKAGMVSLRVYDVLGREVATLVNGQQEAGAHSIVFDAAQSGRSLASGVYLYRLESGSFVATHKMMVLK